MSELAKVQTQVNGTANPDPLIVWQVDDGDWRNWARHYDSMSWTVMSIFATAGVLLGGNYASAKYNHAEYGVLRALATCGIGLILFQMFVVGVFRTYRYELYAAEFERRPGSGALGTFSTWTGTPWVVFCLTAFGAVCLWSYQFSFLVQWPFDVPLPMILGALSLIVLGWVGVWASPPVYAASGRTTKWLDDAARGSTVVPVVAVVAMVIILLFAMSQPHP